MALKYLLDTNTASFIIKGNPPAVRRRLAKLPASRIAISTITEAELRYGVARRPDAIKLNPIVEGFLARVEILPWTSSAAMEYGALRADLEAAGLPMGNLDLLIAAHALAEGLILVSHDAAFRRIKRLKVEDWTAAPEKAEDA
ncbi:MAG: type II toxin-antitoxin system VapC family toxin [Bryobacter sp.]|nr:type II toxin-antitoxin system VapC family toxin [Bryobacter sp.]